MIARGAWHQFGHESASIALDVFPHPGGGGVGAILSPKDSAFPLLQARSIIFRGHGKEVMWDPQYFRLSYQNRFSSTYSTNLYRMPLLHNGTLTPNEKSGLTKALELTNRDLGTAAVIAPAVCLEASNSAQLDINEMLFSLAKQAGDVLGVPTLAAIPIASSASGSEAEVRNIVQRVTSWKADGWYLLYDFDGDPIPMDPARLQLWVKTSLDLAGTGKPLVQGYQGLLSVVAVGLGSHAVALGHFQTLWHFEADHWQNSSSPSRSGPPKFFSVPLWYHLRFPDDFVNLPSPLADPHLTQSPWSAVPVSRRTAASWLPSEARRHFMHVTTEWIDGVMRMPSSRIRAVAAKDHLNHAIGHWAALSRLRYPTPAGMPHADWSSLLDWALTNRASDYDWLDLISV